MGAPGHPPPKKNKIIIIKIINEFKKKIIKKINEFKLKKIK